MSALQTPLRYLLILCLLFNFSCKDTPKTTTTSASEPKANVNNPAFRQKTVEKKIGDCGEGSDCLEVTATYPILSGVKAEIQEKINNDIMEEVIASMEIEQEVKPGPFAIDSATQQWVEAYQEYLNEDLQYRVAMTFQLDGKGSIYKHYAVTELPVSTYTGGAHPNYLSLFSNYNLNTGALIEMEDIISDSIAFKKVVEKAFKQAVEKKEGDLDMSLYFWDKPFYLPANYAITEKGLYFVYNPYEVAPYAFGLTAFTVAYKDLEGLVKLP
ncbi:MAG: hypothetical protein ACI8YQ_002243 [Polaribacter sp.]|jgi:hypothetical protein